MRPSDNPRTWWIVAVIVFGALQVVVSTVRFDRLQADTMDLGYQAQMLWLISHGHWYAFSSIFQTPALAGDGSLWMYPLAYVFRFLGGVYALFVIQGLATVVAAWGIARAAQRQGWGPCAAYWVSVVFCLAPGVLGASQFDYHPDFLALPGLIWGYVWYREGRLPWALAAWIAAALAKNMALVGLAGFGLGLILTRRVRDGLIVAGGSLALFLLELGWIFPHWFPGRDVALNATLYGYLGHSTVAIVAGVLTHGPAVLHHLLSRPSYWLWVFGPVLGLAFAGSASLWAALALFGLNAISLLVQQHIMASQYQVLLTAWLFLALIEALTRWPVWRRRLLPAVALATSAFEVVLAWLVVVPIFVLPAGPMAATRAALATLPRSTVVWTQYHLGTLAYARPVFGQDKPAVPGGPLLDGLPTLWAEAPHAPTALVVATPTSPYLGAVLDRAEAAGYHVTFHRGPVVVLQGTRHFVPPTFAPHSQTGWQPATPWTDPAWTLRAPGTHVDWVTGAVSRPHFGTLLGPAAIWVPGQIRVTLTLAAGGTGTVGSLRWFVFHPGGRSFLTNGVLPSPPPEDWTVGPTHRVRIRAGASRISVVLTLSHPGWVAWQVVGTSRLQVFRVHWIPRQEGS